MSTFYLLPPRPLLGECFLQTVQPLFPGVAWPKEAGLELAQALGATAARQPDVYVIYREELPEGELPSRALANGFGAEPGDRIIEVRPGGKPGEWTTRHWRQEEAA